MKVILFDLRTSGHHIEYVKYLARCMIEKGDKVYFFTASKDENIERLPLKNGKFEVIYAKEEEAPYKPSETGFWRRNFNMYLSLRKCFRFAKDNEVQIIHLMYLEWNELSLLLSQLLTNYDLPPIFGTMVAPYFNLGKGERSIIKGLYYSLNNVTMKEMLKWNWLEGVFTMSRKNRDMLLSRWGVVGKKKVIAVPDPVEGIGVQVSQSKARQKLGLARGNTIFLFFGELRWEKGPDILLEAAKGMDLRKGNVSVVLAGTPNDIDEESVERYRKSLPGDVEIITKLDFISDEQVPYYYLSSDVVVLPYRKTYKGTSGVLQRAISAMRPVIASNVGQIGEIVRSNGFGVNVEPEDPDSLAGIMSEYHNGDIKIKPEGFKENARMYNERHHWKNMAKKIRNAYKKTLNPTQ